MELYIILIIVAVIEVIVLAVIHYMTGNKTVTIIVAVVSGLILGGIYGFSKWRNTNIYTSQNRIQVSSKGNQSYFYFTDKETAITFCNEQRGCDYIISSSGKYYVASTNSMNACELSSASPSTGIWCGIDNKFYSIATMNNSACYANGVYTNCVGVNCSYDNCNNFYNRAHDCNNCLETSGKMWCATTNQCLDRDTSSSCKKYDNGKSGLVNNCNQLLGSYGDIPFYSPTQTELYSKKCTGKSDIEGYGTCSPTLLIQTTPLFPKKNNQTTCNKFEECTGVICDSGKCGYVNETTKPSCCDVKISPYCEKTTYACKGAGCQLLQKCVSA